MSPLQQAFKLPISTEREKEAVLVILQVAKWIGLMFRDDFPVIYYNNMKIIYVVLLYLAAASIDRYPFYASQ